MCQCGRLNMNKYCLSVYFCIFTGMCTQTESEQTPKPTNTQTDWRKQLDKLIWTQIGRDFCQSVKKASPFRGIIRDILSFRLLRNVSVMSV